jgi:threonine/homoserine/homoserine lactone efflux protein
MTVHAALALVAATFIFAAIPGPGVTAVVAQALTRGRRHALLWGLGIVSGDACYLLVAMLGLSWIAGKIGWYFVVLKWLGAAYLAWLGLRYLLSTPVAEAPGDLGGGKGATGRTYLGGLCVSLGNPKVIAFYCGFLPGFVDLPSLTSVDMALVAVLILPTCYCVVAGYACLAARGRGALASGSGRGWTWARRGAGAVMLGTAAVVAAE